MEKPCKIVRRSIHAFFQSFSSFTSIATFFIFPLSASILLCQALTHFSSSPLLTISSRLNSVFSAAGFPTSSKLFPLLNLKLSQTIFSFFFTAPFSFTFLVLAKAAIVKTVVEFPEHKNSPPTISSLLLLYPSILLMQAFNCFITLSANAVVLCLLFIAFTFQDVLGFSNSYRTLLFAVAIVVYSAVLATALLVSEMALIVSAAEKCGTLLSTLKACELMNGRMSAALSLALPGNLAMAAIEALFQYRITKRFESEHKLRVGLVMEFSVISYIYSLTLVGSIIISCMFYKSCKAAAIQQWSCSDDGNCNYRIDLKLEESSLCSLETFSKFS